MPVRSETFSVPMTLEQRPIADDPLDTQETEKDNSQFGKGGTETPDASVSPSSFLIMALITAVSQQGD